MVLDLRPHGDPDDDELAALSLSRADVLDFAVNVNPLGPAPIVRAAIARASLTEYPDATARAARRLAAQSLDVPAEAIIAGNGASELLWNLGRVIIGDGTAVIAGPTFSEMAAAVTAQGGQVHEVRAEESSGFVFSLEALARAARDTGARAVYVCNPNNPTGSTIPARDLGMFAATIQPCVLILDEAFLSLSSHHLETHASWPDNVVRVRSLTKDHALAGVRVAYAIAPPEVARAVEAGRPPWTISTAAQAAMLAAFTPEGLAHVDSSRRKLLAWTQDLSGRLTAEGLSPCPTDTIYFLLPVSGAARTRRHLLQHHHIAVRDCTSFGLPDHIRILGRGPDDAADLIAALTDDAVQMRPMPRGIAETITMSPNTR
jgi:histidinol-phosphate/aromatic aminotransferase/cobyric acid decarboxylase-like protein